MSLRTILYGYEVKNGKYLVLEIIGHSLNNFTERF
jgi:hypothetical protein